MKKTFSCTNRVTPAPENDDVVNRVAPAPENDDVVNRVAPAPENDDVVNRVAPVPENDDVVNRVAPAPENDDVVNRVAPAPENDDVVNRVAPAPENDDVVNRVTPAPENDDVVNRVAPGPENDDVNRVTPGPENDDVEETHTSNTPPRASVVSRDNNVGVSVRRPVVSDSEEDDNDGDNESASRRAVATDDSDSEESDDSCPAYCWSPGKLEQSYFENHWISSALEATSGGGEDEVDGDHSGPGNSFHHFRSLDFQLRFQNVFTTSPTSVRSPLPAFNWADSQEVWKNMIKKELNFQRDPAMFDNHPELQPRMRSILLDWLSEVCEVYRLHKETFTLALDFIDRYLSVTKDVPKTQLQLLGISALFVAAKLEEIYPPKVTEFAYVTDSACSEQDIIRQEMIIVKGLKWNLSPMTTNAWLGVYLQVANMDHITDQELGFVFPQFSTHAYIQISRLCDLSLMDVGSLQFRYSIIAASALYYHTSDKLVMEVSGFNWADLYPCIKWMAPFAKAILEVGQSPIKLFQNINFEDCHNIQTHNVDMALLDRAAAHQVAYKEKEQENMSLDLSAQLVSLLTPSSKAESVDEFIDEERGGS